MKKGFLLSALLRVLAEYIMVFPMLYLISGLMPSPLDVLFLLSVLLYGFLGVLTRRLIPVPWLQLAVGLPACILAAIFLGLTFGSRADPNTYAVPAIIAPLVFFRGKQHGQNDWNGILPTYAPCVIMVFNFILMAFVNYLDNFARFAPLMTVFGVLSLVVTFYSMNYIHRRDLADAQRGQGASPISVSAGLSSQNNVLLVVLLLAGLALSCMPWLLTTARFILKIAGIILGFIAELVFSLAPQAPVKTSSAQNEEPLTQAVMESGFWPAFMNVVMIVICVAAGAAVLFFLFLAIRKGIRALSALLHKFLEQRGFISSDSADFEDSSESIIKLRDLPKKYLDGIKARFSKLTRRGKRWDELKTEAERVRYIYRSSIKRAGRAGYRPKLSDTPREALRDASKELPQLDPVRDELCTDYELVRYGEREPAPGRAGEIKKRSGL